MSYSCKFAYQDLFDSISNVRKEPYSTSQLYLKSFDNLKICDSNFDSSSKECINQINKNLWKKLNSEIIVQPELELLVTCVSNNLTNDSIKILSKINIE